MSSSSIQLNLQQRMPSLDRQPASTKAVDSYPRLKRLMEGEFSVEAGDLLRLVMGFLTSQGLHESARMLRKESGIGFSSGIIRKQTVASSIRRGEWGSVIRATFLLGDSGNDNNNDADNRVNGGDGSINTKICEQVILELAEEDNDLNLAYSLLKVHRDALDRVYEETESEVKEVDGAPHEKRDKKKRRPKSSSSFTCLTKARSLEQKLAEIAANPTKFSIIEERQTVLYGRQKSKQQRRGKSKPKQTN